jgi:hypothetical protein
MEIPKRVHVRVVVVTTKMMRNLEIDNKERRRGLKRDNEGNKDASKCLAIIWRY